MKRMPEITLTTKGAIKNIVSKLLESGLSSEDLIKAMGGRYRIQNLMTAPRRWGRENLRRLYRVWLRQGLDAGAFADALLLDED